MGMGSGERLRTVWTPEMDRYFIDLMLEQAKKGNRFDDQSFSKRAWRNMISSFNDRFRFQYEKDVLKNRHKTLRNLYKAVTTLLEQSGFFWDDTKQMVTAQDHVWDHYIKAHRDARSFQTKTIPYYTDLCLIYKDVTSPDQRGEIIRGKELPALAIQQVVDDDDIIIDGEDYGVKVVESDILKSFEFCRRSRIYWKPPMDRYFIDLMLKQVEEGGRVDRVFRKQAWTEMISSFNSKFGFVNSSDILKNRYKTLRKQYNVINNLLEFEGFVWDDSRQMVTASDNVWQDYIKAHSDARQFMTRPIPYFKDLCKICDPSSEEKEGPWSQDSSEKQEMEKKNKNNNERDFRYLPDSKRPRWNDNEEAVASLSEKKNDTKESSAVTIENVVEAVQALPDMDEDFVLDACDLLEDENKARTFMALDVKLRRKWLVRKLRPHTLI